MSDLPAESLPRSPRKAKSGSPKPAVTEEAPAKPRPLKLAIRSNERVDIRTVYEDAVMVVVEKPAGMVTQPGKGHSTDSLLNGLFVKYGKLLHNLGERRDFGLLHRLDKDTSGLVIVAKMPNAYDQLRRDFEERKIEKEYLTIVRGAPSPLQGVVQARLKEVVVAKGTEFGEDGGAAKKWERSEYGGGTYKKVIISRQGQEAISAYWVLETSPREPRVSLVRVRIKTGRLHQIRAHMMFLGTPVVGEKIYVLPPGGIVAGEGTAAVTKALKPVGVPRLCLHAAHVGFKHPLTGKWVNVESPLPGDLAAYARKMGLKMEDLTRP